MSVGSSALVRPRGWTLLRASDVLLLLVAAVWGSSYALAKEAVSLQPVLGFLALRFGFTAALLAPACSVVGVALINGGAALSLNSGDALILGAALLRAIMVAATRRLTRDFHGSTLALTAVQTHVVALACGVAAAVADGASLSLAGPDLRFVLIPSWLVLACTIFALFAQNYAARRTAASRVSLLMGSEPVFGVLFVVAWLGESFTASAWAGALLIVASCLWAVGRRAV